MSDLPLSAVRNISAELLAPAILVTIDGPMTMTQISGIGTPVNWVNSAAVLAPTSVNQLGDEFTDAILVVTEGFLCSPDGSTFLDGVRTLPEASHRIAVAGDGPLSAAAATCLARSGWLRSEASVPGTAGVQGVFVDEAVSTAVVVERYESILSTLSTSRLEPVSAREHPCLDPECRQTTDRYRLQALIDRDRVAGMLARTMTLQFDVGFLRSELATTTSKLAKAEVQLAQPKHRRNPIMKLRRRVT